MPEPHAMQLKHRASLSPDFREFSKSYSKVIHIYFNFIVNEFQNSINTDSSVINCLIIGTTAPLAFPVQIDNLFICCFHQVASTQNSICCPTNIHKLPQNTIQNKKTSKFVASLAV